MPNNVHDHLRDNPQARKQFLSDVSKLAQKHGVASNDPALQKLAAVETADFSKFKQGLAASSLIITITH